jgi:hypothetical protein
LLELLRVHANQAYAQAQCEAIASDLRTCAFYATAKPPKPLAFITGKVASYDERTGRIRVVYDNSFADWQPAGEGSELKINPLVFAGSYTVTVSGKNHAAESVSIAFDLDPVGAGWFVASFGFDTGGWYQDASLVQGRDDGEPRDIARTKSPAKAGKPFTAVLRVGDDRIRMLFDNKMVIDSPRENAEFGQVGLWKVVCDQLVLEGRIEPSCLQARIDDELGKQREVLREDVRSEEGVARVAVRTPADAAHAAAVVGRRAGAAQRLDQGVRDGAAVDRRRQARGGQCCVRETRREGRVAGRALVRRGAAAREGGARRGRGGDLREAARGRCEDDAGATAACAGARRDGPRRRRDRRARDGAARRSGYEGCTRRLCVTLLRRNRVADARRVVRDAKTKHGLWDETAQLELMLAMASRGRTGRGDSRTRARTTRSSPTSTARSASKRARSSRLPT